MRVGIGGFIGVDDTANERMANDVHARELGERNTTDIAQDLTCINQPALLSTLQVDLRHVTGNDRFTPESNPSQEHFHLFRRGILRLI